jgi:CRISPR-associated Csx2 family protein
VLTLVSFLGKARWDPKTGYQCATYRFNDGDEYTTPFFTLALCKRLKPAKLVVLGTAGSMWPALLEHGAGDGYEEQRLALIESAQTESVIQPQLDVLAPMAAQAIGCAVRLRLIPYARQSEEQLGILNAIANEVTQGKVAFDLTHGFRHLAMLGLLSAFMLERAGRLEVDGLWYGALDMRNDQGIAPVIRLDGLLAIQRWINAIARFDASGDYGVFAPLLQADGVEPDLAKCLADAAFYEMTLNLSDARTKLSTFQSVLDHELPGASGLFRNKLKERLSWTSGSSLAQHQLNLAQRALARNDFLRAAIFGYEAILTQIIEREGKDPLDYSVREQADKAYRKNLKGDTHDQRIGDAFQAFHTLKILRNSLAHGLPPKSDFRRRLLANPAALRTAISECLCTLSPK